MPKDIIKNNYFRHISSFVFRRYGTQIYRQNIRNSIEGKCRSSGAFGLMGNSFFYQNDTPNGV